jgi:hypothetical protein
MVKGTPGARSGPAGGKPRLLVADVMGVAVVLASTSGAPGPAETMGTPLMARPVPV